MMEIPPGKKLLHYTDGIPLVGPADPEERERKIALVLHELALPRIEAIKKALAAQSLPVAQEEAPTTEAIGAEAETEAGRRPTLSIP